MYFFTDRKLSSVQRQLNVYGFRSISRGEHKRSFYHPLFKRGNWDVVRQMQRYVPTKGDQGMDVDPDCIESAVPNAYGANISTVSSTMKQEFGAPNSKAYFLGGAISPAPRNSVSAPTLQHTPANGSIHICMEDDISPDHHFSSDYYATAAVGTEQTNVTIQPVDFSIPLLFQNIAPDSSTGSIRNDDDNVVRMGSNDSYGAVQGEQGDEGNWGISNDSAAFWADLIFDPTHKSSDCLWSSASGGSGPPSLNTGAPCLAAPPEKVTRGRSVESRWCAMSQRFRAESLDDIYDLCSGLI